MRRKRNNILDFKRPRNIQEIRELWFVEGVDKQCGNDGWWIWLNDGYRHKHYETIFIHEDSIKECIEELDSVYRSEWQ
jgi:hypothetical protein